MLGAELVFALAVGTIDLQGSNQVRRQQIRRIGQQAMPQDAGNAVVQGRLSGSGPIAYPDDCRPECCNVASIGPDTQGQNRQVDFAGFGLCLV